MYIYVYTYKYIQCISSSLPTADGGSTAPKKEEPPDTGGGRVFSLDATFGLLATRRRLGRRRDSSALRSALVVWVVCYEGFTPPPQMSIPCWLNHRPLFAHDA